jgi:hypothetical protein
VDFEIGRILRQILERGLYRELGFESFEDYVLERLDLSPRTALRLGRAPEAVATGSSSAIAGVARRQRAARGETSTVTTSSTAPTKDPTMRGI